MKIRSVRTHVLEPKLSEPFCYARAWYGLQGRKLNLGQDWCLVL